jgi:ADP-ribosyl-[dinitrogen reductase] hydrolase
MRTLRDAIYGSAVGDALGVPAEGKERGAYRIESMTGGGTHDMPKGTWSDDTSMTLALCAAINETGKLDLSVIRSNFEKWLYHNEFTGGWPSFSVGPTCLKAIEEKKGQTDPMSNGNGSLMRILPLAFTKADDETIRAVSAITHAHPISMNCCVFYVHLARKLIQGMNFNDALEKASKELSFDVSQNIGEMDESEIPNTGYVVDTLHAALWANAKGKTLKDILLLAVNHGGDTDTIGAVAGGLAGIRFGMDQIPQEWMDDLRGKEELDRYLF